MTDEPRTAQFTIDVITWLTAKGAVSFDTEGESG
jgi:hypothetical protein